MHRIHQGTSGRRCQAPAHSDGFQTVSSALTAVAAAISPSPCCRPDLDPTSKLAAARALSPDTAASSLGDVLGLGEVDEDELYTALDWLLERQPAIEATLANAISPTAHWCSTKFRQAIWKGAAARSPSRCLTAIPPIR